MLWFLLTSFFFHWALMPFSKVPIDQKQYVKMLMVSASFSSECWFLQLFGLWFICRQIFPSIRTNIVISVSSKRTLKLSLLWSTAPPRARPKLRSERTWHFNAHSHSCRMKQPFTVWGTGMQRCYFYSGCGKNRGISSKMGVFLEFECRCNAPHK